MTAPIDDPYEYTPGPRPDGTAVVIRCESGPHRRAGRWLFEHFTGGGWRARRALTPDEADDRDSRAVSSVIRTAGGWRLVCPQCGRDVRFDGERLAAVLDALIAAGVDRVELDTIAQAYKRI